VKPAGTTIQFSPGEPIIVAASLNGTQLSLLLDTGADRTLVTPDAMLRAGYGTLIAQARGSVAIIGVTGAANATQVTVQSLDVAGSRVGPLSVLVHDAGLSGLDGLLGRDVLDAFTVTIDTAAGRATLIPR
jgi:predicted aspartyl protease